MRYLLIHGDDGEASALGARLDRPASDQVLMLRELTNGDVPAVLTFRPEIIVVGVAGPVGTRSLVMNIAAFGRCKVIALVEHRAIDRKGLPWAAAICVAPYSAERVRRLAQLLVPSGRRWEGDPLILRCGDLELREDERVVVAHGARIDLTFSEFELLDVLMRRRGITVTRAELVLSDRAVRAERSRAVDVHIQRIRKKLAGIPGISIETVKGVGYRAQSTSG
jgi:DNA-binding response OmpR family regulator